jgi:hypothetical protein
MGSRKFRNLKVAATKSLNLGINNYPPLSAILTRSHMGKNIANIRKSTAAPRKARRIGSIRLAIFLIE